MATIEFAVLPAIFLTKTQKQAKNVILYAIFFVIILYERSCFCKFVDPYISI